jgi:hypothetical protein
MATKLTDDQKAAQKNLEIKADKKRADDKVQADKDAKVKQAKLDVADLLKNPIDFVRRDIRKGIYSTNALGKRVQIVDRQHYYAKTKAEVDFFNNDPEVVVFDPGTPNKKKK